MDIKTLKKDLIYAIKTLQKDGKTLKVSAEEMEYIEGKYQLTHNEFDPFQALALIKGWQPVSEYLTYLASLKRATEVHESFVQYVKSMEGMRFATPEDQKTYLDKAPVTPSVDAPLGYSEWGYLLSLLIKETGIEGEQWYSFMDGFDFADRSVKDEFYEMGVYMREKFQPVDGRKELLVSIPFERELIKETPIRKFVVPQRGKLAVMEAEVQKITDPLYRPGACPEVKGLLFPDGGAFFRVLKPTFLWYKLPNGTLVPTAISPTLLHDTVESAMKECEQNIRSRFRFEMCKGRRECFTEEEVATALAEVKTIML